MVFRTINQTIELIKKEDPDTAVTIYLIRRLAKMGQVKSIQAGKKYIVDFNSVKKYLGITKEA
jgi:hypothetical protein